MDLDETWNITEGKFAKSPKGAKCSFFLSCNLRGLSATYHACTDFDHLWNKRYESMSAPYTGEIFM